MTRTQRKWIVPCGALMFLWGTPTPAQDLGDFVGDTAELPSLVGDSGSGELLLSAAGMYTSSPGPLSLLPSLSAGGVLGPDDTSYLELKAGPLWFFDDLEDLDTGANIELIFGRKLVGPLSAELGTGFFWVDDRTSFGDTEVWGVPLTANLRVSLPVLIFDIYGGGGIGGYYIDTEINPSFSRSRSDEDIVFGGNLFVGLKLRVWKLTAGIEGKYIATTDASLYGSDISIQAFAAMLSVGLTF